MNEHSKIMELENKMKLHKICMKEAIKKEKRKLHKEYVELNKKKLVLLDIAFVCVILFNLGAVILTNLVVVKADPAKEFVEANQVQCNWNGYACAEENIGKKMVWSLVKQAFIWAVLTFLYLFYRVNVYTDEGFFLILFVVLFYFWATNIDFIHDLGLYLGKVIWVV